MGAPLDWTGGKTAAMRTSCRNLAAADRPNVHPRPLHWLAPTNSTDWPINCGAARKLCDVVEKVAIDRAVMMAVANKNIAHEQYV